MSVSALVSTPPLVGVAERSWVESHRLYAGTVDIASQTAIDLTPYVIEDGGALDIDLAPDCWEKRAHVERYLWAAKVFTGMKVLDFGCGVGHGSQILQENGKNVVTGIDTSQEALARASARRRGLGIDFCTWAGLGTDFNGIVAFEVLEHLHDPEGYLFLFRKRAQHLVASVPVVPTLHANPHHRHDFTIDNFIRLVEKNFRIQSKWTQNMPGKFGPTYLILHGESL